MWIGRKIICGGLVNVCEVAAASAGDANLLSHSVIVFEQENSTPALARLNRAEKPGSASANHDYVPLLHQHLALAFYQIKFVMSASEENVRRFLFQEHLFIG